MQQLDWIIELYGQDQIDKALTSSWKLLLEDVMINYNGFLKEEPRVFREDEIIQSIEVFELSLLQAIKDNDDIKIKNISENLFQLYRVLKLSSNPILRIKQMVKISCFAILGEKNADIRRWLNDNAILQNFEGSNWAEKVFYDICVAFLLNVRKQGWDDLENATLLIKELRDKQKKYEKNYLNNDIEHPQFAALELIALYHLAKAIDILAEFFRTGYKPRKTLDDITFHLDKAFETISQAGIAELGLTITWLRYSIQRMVKNSVWWILTAINSNISRFVKNLTSKTNPIFELWPPQSKALLEEGLLDPAKRAIVIEMPTSGGKTLLAEFRILQTKQLYPSSWVAYIVPTRALVNQITNRLREDLTPLGLIIESAVPAFELDPLEEELLLTEESFDVLVTTQEKLDLLIRGGKIDPDDKPLGLVILDEAHNIKSGDRGLRIELLLAIINREFQNVQFLLLTPFVPNIEELANWLDSERSAKISLHWKPNVQLVGLVYPEGRAKEWNLKLKTLYTSQPTIHIIKENIIFKNSNLIDKNKSNLSKMDISASIGAILSIRSGVIIIVQKKNHVNEICRKINDIITPPWKKSVELKLIQDYIASEFSEDFMLYSLIENGIAFHHAGVSQELRYMLEWLMRRGDLRVIVATTTLAQGVNFPISAIVMNDYITGIPPKPMETDTFWNIAGRAGRADQETLGIIAFSSKYGENDKIEEYVKNEISNLISYLEEIVMDTIKRGYELDFKLLVRNNPEWSHFIQYLCHSYRQIGNHSKFIAQTETLMKATYGFQRIRQKHPDIAQGIIDATIDYAREIQKIDPQILYLVDQTGFSPDSIRNLRSNMSEIKFEITDLSASGLFSTANKYLKDIVGNLLNVPELDFRTEKGKIEGRSLADILTLWVNGKPISQIAQHPVFLGEDGDITTAVTRCNEALTNIINYTSWGLGAIESISLKKEEIEKLDKREQLEIRALPAMVFFGVNSLEGVVMRNLGVPRSIAKSLGERYTKETGDEIPSIIKVREWLDKTTNKTWGDCIPPKSKLNGEEYRKIWHIMTGKYG